MSNNKELRFGVGPAPKMWVGNPPKHCDICNAHITVAFVDGRTYNRAIRGNPGGRWAIMCLLCHSTQGTGLGEGSGQQFEKTRVVHEGGASTVHWVKVRG